MTAPNTCGGGIDPLAVIGRAPEHRSWNPSDDLFPPEIASTARIEAFVSVDAGTFRATTIGARTWLLKKCHVGHDAVLGDDVEVTVGAVIGGEVNVGDRVRVGLGAIILPQRSIGHDARIGAGAVVTRDVPPGQVWEGVPAHPHVFLREEHARFWRRVAIEGVNECWDWTGPVHQSGHGQTSYKNKPMNAQRLAFWFGYSKDPGEFVVRHICDRAICCNPAHLCLGTARDNAEDARDRQRMSRRFGERHHSTKLRDSEVAEAKRLYGSGVSQTELAKRFGVSASLVSMIVNGKHRALTTDEAHASVPTPAPRGTVPSFATLAETAERP